MPNFLDDYEPVEDRLRDFHDDFPDGRVMTTLISYGDGDYIVYAEVWRTQGEWPAASGLAHDSEAQLPPNMKASALEVCETSAIGRALANLGYAAKGKRPSREEMSKASGVEAGGSPNRSSQDPAPGTTSVVDGEAAADTGPGEVNKGSSSSPSAASSGPTKDAPGPPHYPLTPAECDHLGKSGHLLRPRKSPRGPVCPRCGLSYITVTEGTAADLGSA